MSEQLDKPKTSERLLRFGRNINYLGAAAIGGVALVIPGPNVLLGTWAAVNAAQGVGFEALRRGVARKAKTKTKS